MPYTDRWYRKPNIRTVQPTQQRVVSSRRPSRTTPRTSSIIIHDDAVSEGASDPPNHVNENHSSHVPEHTSSPQTRARSKAFATQTRLGVGRPVAAGGKGARAMSKSLSLTKKRGKSSRSLPPADTIVEGSSTVACGVLIDEYLYQNLNPLCHLRRRHLLLYHLAIPT